MKEIKIEIPESILNRWYGNDGHIGFLEVDIVFQLLNDLRRVPCKLNVKIIGESGESRTCESTIEEDEIENIYTDFWGSAGPDCISERLVPALIFNQGTPK